MLRKLIAVSTAVSFLLVGSAGAASARSDQWLGKPKAAHVKPLRSEKWTVVKPLDSRWTKIRPLSDQWL